MLGKSLRNYIVIVFVICLMGATAIAKDYVVVKGQGDNPNKEYNSARILDFTQTHLVFENETMDGEKANTESVKAKWSDVVSWGIDPSFEKSLEFSMAYKAMRDTDFRTAITGFDKVINSNKVSAIEKHLAFTYIIYCGYVGNDSKNFGFKVIDLYTPEFKKAFPNSYFLKEAYDTWGRSLQQQGKNPQAKKIFEELKEYSQALSSMRLGIMVYLTGDYEKAVPMFQKAVTTADNELYTKDLSNVLLAHCYQKLQNWTNAKQILEKLTGDTEEASTFADVLGKANLYLTIEYGRTGDYYKSFIASMKAYTVYKDNLNSQEEKDTLAYALICAQELGKQDEKWVKRAQTLESTYKEAYPNEFDKRKIEFPK